MFEIINPPPPKKNPSQMFKPNATHGRRNRGAGGAIAPPPPIFCQPKKLRF